MIHGSLLNIIIAILPNSAAVTPICENGNSFDEVKLSEIESRALVSIHDCFTVESDSNNCHSPVRANYNSSTLCQR